MNPTMWKEENNKGQGINQRTGKQKNKRQKSIKPKITYFKHVKLISIYPH